VADHGEEVVTTYELLVRSGSLEQKALVSLLPFGRKQAAHFAISIGPLTRQLSIGRGSLTAELPIVMITLPGHMPPLLVRRTLCVE